MDMDQMAQRFLDEVRLRAYSDHYLDPKEEREILQVAIAGGVSAAAARQALLQVSSACGYVVESAVLEETRELLTRLHESEGQIDEKEFAEAVTFLRQRTLGHKDEAEAKRIVLEIIKASNYKTSHGWFSSWLTRVKKDLGLA